MNKTSVRFAAVVITASVLTGCGETNSDPISEPQSRLTYSSSFNNEPIIMSSISDTSNVPEYSEPQSKPYAHIDFAIEGKWKNIGTQGFGQAQPGAIVSFDGVNCNFYSPKDTYAFYKDNGKWVLDCTNVLWRDTLSFEVEIIGSDMINVIYGNIITELERKN